jgi:hypothetical protein
MNVWLWAYGLGPYSPNNPTNILVMLFWFIVIWTWFERANLDTNGYGMKRIAKEVCGNLIKSMPRRIEGVIKPKGGQMRCRQKN